MARHLSPIPNCEAYVAYGALFDTWYHFSKRCGKSSESMNKLSLIYFALSVITLGIGCLFFIKELKNSGLSPAASRYREDY